MSSDDEPTSPGTPRSLTPVGIGVQQPPRPQPRKLSPPPKPYQRKPTPPGTVKVCGVPMGIPMPELSRELEERCPRLCDADDDDHTWAGMERPRLVADSNRPHGRHDPTWEILRAVEAGTVDAKQRAHRAELEARESKLLIQEQAARREQQASDNAAEHLTIAKRLESIEHQLPKAMRSGRLWSVAGGLLLVLASFWTWLGAREGRLAAQEAAVRAASITSAR